MNLSAAQLLDRWIGIPVCALLSLIHRFGRRPLGRHVQPRSVLCILISEMGSVLLAYPMLAELRRRYPEANLHFLIFGKNRECLELLDLIPPQNVIPLEHRSLLGFMSSAMAAVVRLRRLRIDLVIDFELFSRVSAILAVSSGATHLAGFHRHEQEGLYRGSFWTHPVLYNPYLHMSRNFFNLLEALAGSGRPLVKTACNPVEPCLPRLPPDEAREQWAARELQRSCPSMDADTRIVLFNPGGGALPIRAWPLESYVELAQLLLRRPELRVGVIGLQEEDHFYSDMAAKIDSDRFFDLTGKTPQLLDLIAILDASHVLVTADGGPAHFASLSRIRTVVFFGPESPVLYRPLGDNHTCLYAGIACSPCLTAYNHRHTPCDGDNVCLKRFEPARVERVVLDQLGIEA